MVKHRYPKGGITGDPLVDGGIWGRGKVDGRRILITTSSWPGRFIDEILARLEKLGFDTEFQMKGDPEEPSGSRIIASPPDEVNLDDLPEYQRERAVDPDDPDEFLYGFLFSRLRKSGPSMHFTWNNGAEDGRKLLTALGIEWTASNDSSVRIRSPTSSPVTDEFAHFVREERKAAREMADTQPAPQERELSLDPTDPAEAREEWEELADSTRKGIRAVLDIIRECPQPGRRIIEIYEDRYRGGNPRVLVGQLDRLSDHVEALPEVRHSSPHFLDSFTASSGRPEFVYWTPDEHHPVDLVYGAILTNLDDLEPLDSSDLEELIEAAVNWFPPGSLEPEDLHPILAALETGEPIQDDAQPNALQEGGRLKWSTARKAVQAGELPWRAPVGTPSEVSVQDAQRQHALVAGLLEGLGEIVNGGVLSISLDHLHPEGARVLGQIVDAYGIEVDGRLLDADTDPKTLEGKLPLPTPLWDIFRLGEYQPQTSEAKGQGEAFAKAVTSPDLEDTEVEEARARFEQLLDLDVIQDAMQASGDGREPAQRRTGKLPKHLRSALGASQEQPKVQTETSSTVEQGTRDRTDPLTVQAFQLAEELHEGHLRKGTEIPYTAHLLGVASIVQQHGGSPEETAAALLHDAAEDQGGRKVLERIRRELGDVVADIVEACSDSLTEDPTEKEDWWSRKCAHLQALPEKGRAALIVTAADKLQNADALLRDLNEEGQAIWDRFNAPRDQQLWYYRSTVQALQVARRDRELPEGLNTLIDRLDRKVTELAAVIEE